MAGRGPAKAVTHTRKRNDTKLIQLVSDGKTRGKPLPSNVLFDAEGNSQKWHAMTVKWWNNWRKSPQAVRMITGPDWDYLLDTARLHHEFWSTGNMGLEAGLRLRLQKFGATPADRTSLGVEVAATMPDRVGESEEAPTVGNVTSIDDRRTRLALEG